MRVIYPLAAFALVAAGCSTDRESEGATGTSGTGSIGAASTSVATPAPSSEASTPAGSAPTGSDVVTTAEQLEGTQDVTLAGVGISFAAPETYTPLVPTELPADFYESAGFIELAERVHIEPETLAESLRERLAAFLFAPAAAEGYVDNISVSTSPGGSLPDEAAAVEIVEALGATDVAVGPLEVDGADAVVLAYARPGSDGDLYARDVMVEARGAVVTVSVVTAARDEADVVSNVVTSTLTVEQT
jgi:hypothetical protein